MGGSPCSTPSTIPNTKVMVQATAPAQHLELLPSILRSAFNKVLWHLEYALQLHEAWMRANATETSITSSQALEDLEFRVACR
ncbi:hypothetical protein OIU78_015949, partial [Salix suchowensis]